MGGMGSGNWSRWHTKSTTGAAKRIDVRFLAHHGYLRAGKRWELHWTCNGEPSGCIGGATVGNTIVLLYRVKDQGASRWEDVQQAVDLTHTSCHFGGQRPWFRCPFCGKRVAVLYLGARARCRHCANLAYDSQNESAHDRMFRKARKIRKKLQAGDSCFDSPILFKPKGMHQKTFDRLRAEAMRQEGVGLEAMLGRLRSLNR